LHNFDYVVAPEHDGLIGKNVLSTKGAIHYLTKEEINSNKAYLIEKLDKGKSCVVLILGGSSKYYDYTIQNLSKVFDQIKKVLEESELQMIVIPSMRTPNKIIDLANDYFGKEHLVIKNVDKKAYLSGLSLAKYIIVTCDSSSMVSEAALTGKPIYIANILPKRNDTRFQKFRNLFRELNIIRNLGESFENWNYQKLDETNRVAKIIKERIHY
jgi:mitochondrial fission protein ELM1